MPFNQFNNTSKFLSHLIFQNESFSVLKNFGLENVFIGDYGYKRMHNFCLYFLINPQVDIDGIDYAKFEEKITSFDSFYDWYDIEDKKKTKRMYVFNVHPFYREDFYNFTNNNFKKLSKSYWKSLGARVELDISHVEFLLENEIYRFKNTLTIKRGE